MNNVKRYYTVVTNEKIFDRMLHTVVPATDITDIDELMPISSKSNPGISVYPRTSRKLSCIPIKLLVIIYSVSVIAFLASLLLVIFSRNSIITSMIFPSMLFVLPLLLTSLILHECAHAIVGLTTGGILCEIGFRKYKSNFQFITFMYFCTLERVKRVLYYFAGISINMLLSLCGALAFNMFGNIIFFYVFVINVALTVINSMPIKRKNTDGFNMLMSIKAIRSNN